jgi:transposase
MATRQFPTDERWAILAPLNLPPTRRDDSHGQPVEHDERSVMVGVYWVLCTGAAWADLPERYPSYSMCFRRFSRWVRDGTLRGILDALAQDLEDRGQIDLSECFIDGTFVVAKRGHKVGKTKRDIDAKLMAITDASGLPLAVHADSASSHEITLVQATIDETVTLGVPERLVGDRAMTMIRSMTGFSPSALN